MPKYKYGKQCEQLTVKEIQDKVFGAESKLNKEALAFFWLAYYTGARKSELYERTIEDCSVSETHFIIDFHKRKKGSSEVPALEIPLWFPGMNLVCAQLKKSRERRKTRKLIEKTVKGVRSTKRLRARWLFPHVHRAWALVIVKEILGSQYYPHFLRLNRITELCSDPEVNISMIKSYTGIRSLKVIQGYIGTSKKEQEKAMNFMAKQIRENQQKESEQK